MNNYASTFINLYFCAKPFTFEILCQYLAHRTVSDDIILSVNFKFELIGFCPFVFIK